MRKLYIYLELLTQWLPDCLKKPKSTDHNIILKINIFLIRPRSESRKSRFVSQTEALINRQNCHPYNWAGCLYTQVLLVLTHNHKTIPAALSDWPVTTRDARFGSKVGQINPKWDKSGAFSDLIWRPQTYHPFAQCLCIVTDQSERAAGIVLSLWVKASNTCVYKHPAQPQGWQ